MFERRNVSGGVDESQYFAFHHGTFRLVDGRDFDGGRWDFLEFQYNAIHDADELLRNDASEQQYRCNEPGIHHGSELGVYEPPRCEFE